MTIDNMRWHRSFRKHVVFCQTPGQSLVSMILMTDFYEYYSYIFSSCCYPRHFRYVCLLLIDVTQFVFSCLTSERFFHVVHSIQLLSALFRQTFTVNGLKRRDIYMPLLFYFCYTQCSLTKMKSKRCCLLCRLLGAAVAALWRRKILIFCFHIAICVLYVSTSNDFIVTSIVKQLMGCEAQLARKCLFTPTFIGRRFGRVK